MKWRQNNGAKKCFEVISIFRKIENFQKITYLAPFRSIHILAPFRHEKSKVRPIFDLGLAGFVNMAPIAASRLEFTKSHLGSWNAKFVRIPVFLEVLVRIFVWFQTLVKLVS